VTSLRANGEASIFPYRNGFAAYVWITTPSRKRQRKYVYGRSGEIVHGPWVELTRKAARGPVVTKVPTVGQFLHRWLEETVAPNLAPLTYATYERRCGGLARSCTEIAAVLCRCTRSSKAPIQNLNMRLTRHSAGRGDRI
jgi:hypothetical protein